MLSWLFFNGFKAAYDHESRIKMVKILFKLGFGSNLVCLIISEQYCFDNLVGGLAPPNINTRFDTF